MIDERGRRRSVVRHKCLLGTGKRRSDCVRARPGLSVNAISNESVGGCGAGRGVQATPVPARPIGGAKDKSCRQSRVGPTPPGWRPARRGGINGSASSRRRSICSTRSPAVTNRREDHLKRASPKCRPQAIDGILLPVEPVTYVLSARRRSDRRQTTLPTRGRAVVHLACAVHLRVRRRRAKAADEVRPQIRVCGLHAQRTVVHSWVNDSEPMPLLFVPRDTR